MVSRRSALRGFIVKEIHHILRDRQTLLILLVLPLAMVVIFGYALRTDVKSVRVVFVERVTDAATVELRNRFAGSGRFEFAGVERSLVAVESLFRRGDIDMAVVFEPGFGEALSRGSGADVMLIADASAPNAGSLMLAYATAVIGQYQDELGRPPGAVEIEVHTRMRFNPSLESVNLFVPGLIALVMTLVTALMTAISLSREKERGTLEVLLVSPLRPWQIIVGKVAPYLLLAFVNVVTALLAASIVFGVPFRGSIPLLVAASTLYAMVGLALGTLIAARTDSQRAAMLGAMLVTMMPNMLLSGMIFPLSSLPVWLQPVTYLVPARWFILISRGVMLKGVGVEYLVQPLAVLAVMLVFLMVAAVRSFKPRLA
jgi:ABC-2 type transport system permease protein